MAPAQEAVGVVADDDRFAAFGTDDVLPGPADTRPSASAPGTPRPVTSITVTPTCSTVVAPASAGAPAPPPSALALARATVARADADDQTPSVSVWEASDAAQAHEGEHIVAGTDADPLQGLGQLSRVGARDSDQVRYSSSSSLDDETAWHDTEGQAREDSVDADVAMWAAEAAAGSEDEEALVQIDSVALEAGVTDVAEMPTGETSSIATDNTDARADEEEQEPAPETAPSFSSSASVYVPTCDTTTACWQRFTAAR